MTPTSPEKKRIAAAVRSHLARKRMSREQFAHATKLGKSTVDKLMTGLFSERTLAIVEEHTGLALREMLLDATTLPQAAVQVRPERRLAAILAADVAGFARLVHADESGTLALLDAHRAVMDRLIGDHGGRIANTAGDSVLAEFASVVDAVECALAVQDEIAAANAAVADDRRVVFRIGVHCGEVVPRGRDLLGEGVNIAARIERLAEPGGICLSAAALEQVGRALPLAVEDLGARHVHNIAEPVRVFAVRRVQNDAALPSHGPALPAKPSIAVLPFTNMDRAPSDDTLADGLTEDIITALARLRWLFVIARNSSFVYKGRAVDIRQVARELGVRYVLEGSVRTAGERIRVTGQLIDAESGKHIWAAKYDRRLDDIFAVQDEIAESVVAAVEPHVYAEEGFRAAARQPESIDAWGLVVRALSLTNKVERRRNEEARALLEKAVAIAPDYARAHALMSWATWWAALCYWFDDTRAAYRRAAGHARDALSFDPNDPWARMAHGLCLSTEGRHEPALAELRTALGLNPSFALGHMAYGWALLRAGQFEEAIEETGRALRMSPLDSFSGFYTSIHGLALLGARRFEEALPQLRASVAAFAEYSGHYNSLISCCGHLGRLEEAREFIAQRNRVGPPIRLSVLRENLKAFAHYAVFLEGLEKAGVPE